MRHAGEIFVEISCAAYNVSLLQDGLWGDDVHMPHCIAKADSEQLNLSGFSHGIQQPVFNGWLILDGRVRHGFYEPGKVGGLVQRVA